MISFNKGTLEIKGSNVEVITDFNFIVDELLKSHPEIVIATIFERNEQITKCLSKCNEKYLESASVIVKRTITFMEDWQ